MFFYKMSAFIFNDKWNMEFDERLKARELRLFAAARRKVQAARPDREKTARVVIRDASSESPRPSDPFRESIISWKNLVFS